MKYTRRMLAWGSGVALYAAVIVASGFVGDSSVPVAVASALGEPGSVGYALGQGAVVAIFVFHLAFGWTYVTLRLVERRRTLLRRWCASGLFCGFLVTFMVGLQDAAERAHPEEASFAAMLLSPVEPPLWGVLNLIAAPLGLWFAGRFVRYAAPSVRRPRSLAVR
jgi:hypothetical protein